MAQTPPPPRRSAALKDRTAVTVRWAAHDDNGDDLIYSLYLRGDGETVWRLLKKDISDKAYSFDATLIPDGGYQIKVVASDAPSHTPADALKGEKVSDRFQVDTTPPPSSRSPQLERKPIAEADSCTKPFQVSFEAEDAASPVAHAEYSLDAGPWQYIEPVGKISDSRHRALRVPHLVRNSGRQNRRAPHHGPRLRPLRQRRRSQNGDSCPGKVVKKAKAQCDSNSLWRRDT